MSISTLNTTGAQTKPSKETAIFTGPEFKIGTGHVICFPVNDKTPVVVKQSGSSDFRQDPNLHIAEPETTALIADPRMVTNDAPFPRTLVGSMVSGM
jgi:hypothetical protein